MMLPDEAANFIIDYVEQSTNNTPLVVYNNKTEEAWLKLAPQLNAICKREMVFRDWKRIFNNWTRNTLTKHRQNKQLNPHEERYMQLRDRIKMSMTVSVTVSVLTLTIISIHRWYALCFPLKFKSTTGRAKSAIIIIWILALLFDVPELIVYHTEEQNYYKIETFYLTQCTPSWSGTTNHLWNLWKMLSLYLIPLIIMATSYYNIITVLWKPNRTHHELDIVDNTQLYTFSISPNSNTKGQLRSRKKAAKMLVSVVIMFAICYFPIHLHNVLRIAMRLSNSDGNRIFSFISHWLCYANSAMNPLIYNFMSGKFRKEFKRSYECCCKSSKTRNQRKLLCLYNKDSSFKSRTSSKQSKQKNGFDVKRTNTVITKITE